MSVSEEQHDEQPSKAAPGDVVREAVERTLRDTAAALQRLAPPADAGTAGTEAELIARVEELTARVERLESKVKKLKKQAGS